MSFNAAQKKVSPEEVLRKAKQLLNTGKKKLAVEELQSWLVSKRRFQWEDMFVDVAILYVDLSVSELRSCKDGMVSFRNMTQQNKPATLEKLLRHCINAAQKRGDKMAEQLEKDLLRQKKEIFQQFIDEQKKKHLINDDTKCDEISAVSSPQLSNEVLKRNRELRRKLEDCENEWHLQQFENETLNFQWCCYLDVLFIIRNNGKLNHVFMDTAMRAARFCQRLKRTNELRGLCETVRKRFYHLSNNQGFEYALKLSDAGVVNELVGLRVYLFQTALILGMHNESFKSMKDIVSIMNLIKTEGCLVPGTNASNVTIDPFLLSLFYKQCSHVFWFCQRYLLHAYSLYYSYLYYARWIKGGAMPPLVNIPAQTKRSEDEDEFEQVELEDVIDAADASKEDDSKNDELSGQPSSSKTPAGKGGSSKLGPWSHIKTGTALDSSEIAVGGYSTALPQPFPPYPCLTPTNTDLLFLSKAEDDQSSEASASSAAGSVDADETAESGSSRSSEFCDTAEWLNHYNGFVCFDLSSQERKVFLQKKLNQAMLAALIVPPLNRTKSQELMLSGDSALKKMFEEFGFEEPCTRDTLIDLLLREKELPTVSRRLFSLIELDNSPVNFTMKFRKLLEEMMEVSPEGYSLPSQQESTPKKVTSIARTFDSKLRSEDGLMYSIRILYQNFVNQLAVLRLLDRLSRVYTSISWDRFLSFMGSLRLKADKSVAVMDHPATANTFRDELVKRTVTGLNGLNSGGSYKESLEKIIVSCIRDSGSLNVAVRLDDSANLIVFGEESGWSMGIGDNNKNAYATGGSSQSSRALAAIYEESDEFGKNKNDTGNVKGLSDELVLVCNKFDEIAAKLIKRNYSEINEQRVHVFDTIREKMIEDHTLIVGRFDESDKQKTELNQWKQDKVKKAKHEEKVEELKKIQERRQAEQKAEEVRKEEEYQQKLKERRQLHTKKVIESVKKSAIIENAAAVVINSTNIDRKNIRPLSAAAKGASSSSSLLSLPATSQAKSKQSTAAWKSQKVWSTKETKSLLKESQAVKKVQETVQNKSLRLNQLVSRAKRGEILSEADLSELHDLQWELENSMRREKKERMKQERRQYDYFIRAQRKHLESTMQDQIAAIRKRMVKPLKSVFKAQQDTERKQWESDRARKAKLDKVLSFMGEFESQLVVELNTRKEAQLKREKAAADAEKRRKEERQIQAEQSKKKEEKRRKRMEKERIAREQARDRGIKFQESMVDISDDSDDDDYDEDAPGSAPTGAGGSSMSSAEGRKSTTVVEAGSNVKYSSREAMFSRMGISYGGSSSSSSKKKSSGVGSSSAGGSRFPGGGGSSAKKQTRKSPSPPPAKTSPAGRIRRDMGGSGDSSGPPKKAAYRPPREVAPPPAKKAFRASREAVSYDPNAPSSVRGSGSLAAGPGTGGLRPASLVRPTAAPEPAAPPSGVRGGFGSGRSERDFGRPPSSDSSAKKEKKKSKFGKRFANLN